MNENSDQGLKPMCFVIMPFSVVKDTERKYGHLGRDELDTIYDLLREILSGLGFSVSRASSVGDILAEIVYSLDKAELVVADLTGLNPNVMYELGIRHGFTKKTILLSQDLLELPFDLRHYHCIEYSWVTSAGKRKLREDIRNTLSVMEGNPRTVFGPVHGYLGTKRFAVREEENRLAVKKLEALSVEISTLSDLMGVGMFEFFEKFEDKTKLPVDMDGVEVSFQGQMAVRWIPVKELGHIFVPTGVLKSLLGQNLPAFDHLLTERYLPSELDQYEDISKFYWLLGVLKYNMRRDDLNYSEVLFYHELLKDLYDDCVTIKNIVEQGTYGAPLSLKSSARYEQHLRNSTEYDSGGMDTAAKGNEEKENS